MIRAHLRNPWLKKELNILMNFPEKKSKKIDHEALNSGLMRIPRIQVAVVRDLLDIGFREIEELKGRAPEALFEDLRKKKPHSPQDRIYAFRMAVYYAETPNPDPKRLHPWAWQD